VSEFRLGEKLYRPHCKLLGFLPPKKWGRVPQKLRPAYETSPHLRYIHNNFPWLHRCVSKISAGKIKKTSVKLNSAVLMNG